MPVKEPNRSYLLRTATKLLCRDCDPPTPRLVTDYFPSGKAKLVCGHRRDAGLAPEPDGEK